MLLQRAWHLLGLCEWSGEPRTLELIRIRHLTVLDRTFIPAPAKQVQRCFGSAWNMVPEGRMYDVHIRFEPKVATDVARSSGIPASASGGTMTAPWSSGPAWTGWERSSGGSWATGTGRR
jgi:predicted DNA-binding transcriptional regulator YafY